MIMRDFNNNQKDSINKLGGMMPDILDVFGVRYNGVEGFKATDNEGSEYEL